jgi:hypothetical protein
MLMCVSLSTLAHETAGAARTRLSLRPLFKKRANEMQGSDKSCRENAKCCLNANPVIASEAKQSIGPHIWIDGLLRRYGFSQ